MGRGTKMYALSLIMQNNYNICINIVFGPDTSLYYIDAIVYLRLATAVFLGYTFCIISLFVIVHNGNLSMIHRIRPTDLKLNICVKEKTNNNDLVM